MKIVYSLTLTSNMGGIERVSCDKANYLVGLGHDVTIITTDQKGKDSYYELDKRIKIIDLDINYEIDYNRCLLKKLVDFFPRRRKHKRRLKETLYKLRADVVISTFKQETRILCNIKDGSKKILESHLSKDKNIDKWHKRKGIWGIIDRYNEYLDKFSVLKYDRFVVLTEEDKHLWGDLPNIEVIPILI